MVDDGMIGIVYCLLCEVLMVEIVEWFVVLYVFGVEMDDFVVVWERMLCGSVIVGWVGFVRWVIGLVDIVLWDIVVW